MSNDGNITLCIYLYIYYFNIFKTIQPYAFLCLK